MAARSSFTRSAFATITSAWANSLRDHVVSITTSDDVSSEGQLAVNTGNDRLVVHNGTSAIELARYGALSSLTLSATQSFSVVSTNYGGFQPRGKWVEANVVMAFGSNGSTGQPIVIDTDLPAPDRSRVCGTFVYDDAGTAIYVGAIVVTTSSQLFLSAHNTTSNLGQSPSFAITSGDTLYLSIAYPWA